MDFYSDDDVQTDESNEYQNEEYSGGEVPTEARSANVHENPNSQPSDQPEQPAESLTPSTPHSPTQSTQSATPQPTQSTQSKHRTNLTDVTSSVDLTSPNEEESNYSNLFEPVLSSSIISQHPRYFKLTVGEPQKINDGNTAYISYLVTSQARSEDSAEKVRRRFKEFQALHSALARAYTTCVVPPLPDKSRLEYISGDRFSPEFTLKRAVALSRFLFRISQHDELKRSRAFAQFLQPNNTGSSGRNEVDFPKPRPSMLDHFSDSVMNAFVKARYMSKEMINARDRAGRFEHNIMSIERAVQRVSKTQTSLSTDFSSISRFASQLAAIDPASQSEFEALGVAGAILSASAADLRRSVDNNFSNSLREMANYVQVLKAMLRHREQRQIDYEVLAEYLKKSEHELVAVEHGSEQTSFSSSFLKSKINELRGISKDAVREQKSDKLRARIDEFKKESNYAKQLSDELEVLARREVRTFEQTEAIELQETLSGLTDNYIAYYRDVLDQCRALEKTLD